MNASFRSAGSLICPLDDPEETASEVEEALAVSVDAADVLLVAVLDAADVDAAVEDADEEPLDALDALEDDPHAARPTVITATIATDNAFFICTLLLLVKK